LYLTQEYEFEASGFQGIPPETTVMGNFTAKFVPFSGSSVGINYSALDSIDLNIDGFSYNLANTALMVRDTNEAGSGDFSGRFELGGQNNGGVYGIAPGTDDFQLFFSDDQGNFSASHFAYTVAGDPGVYFASSLSIARVTAVPEPASASLIALGTVSLCLTRRRRRSPPARDVLSV